MPTVDWLHPLDQPFGSTRAAEWVREALRSGNYESLRLIVAYAKEGELLRLADDFATFRGNGGTVETILGFDQKGTSRQAVAFASANFDDTWMWQHPSRFITFHPKEFLFEGQAAAEAHVGSCNLTVGGFETNAEAALRLRYSLPEEQDAWDEALRGWNELQAPHANLQPLTPQLLAWMEARGLLLDEGTLAGARLGQRDPKSLAGSSPFPATPFIPPMPRPSGAMGQRARPGGGRGATRAPSARAMGQSVVPSSLPRALLIQINPHHNGEIFLSKLAVNQHPSFFGFPFTGETVPKKYNSPYPQRVPDPITDWVVYDASGALVYAVSNFPLNTVFYEQKGEIRVTVAPGLRDAIVPYSILQMTRVDVPPPDYVCEVFAPNSPQYRQLIQACNQTMPSGGGVARKFGWI